MLNCEQVTALCSEEMERSLRLGEKIALGAHLWMCTDCTTYRKQMQSLRDVAQTYASGRATTTEPGDMQTQPGGGSE